MKVLKKFSIIFAFAILSCVVIFTCACSNISKDGTAAVVNDVKITEDQVTQKVMEYRTAYNLQDDEA